MSSKEMAPSSNESKTIGVGGTECNSNPFGDMNVEDIPIEIVDDFNDLTGDEVMVTEVEEPPVCVFSPLSDEDCVCVALKFSLVINFVGKKMRNPTATVTALGNGTCLFKMFSLLLCGQDTYSAII